MKLTGGDQVVETVKFVDMFNKLFDCLNVGDYVTGKRSRNCFKSPYYTPDDFRIKVCVLYIK